MQLICLEDDPGLGVLLRRHLHEHGHQVTIADSLRVARELLSANRYDLILADQELPDGSGLDLIKEQSSAAVSTPVIMLTGMGNEQLAVAALQAGARDYVVKDIENNFLTLLPNVLERIRAELVAERDRSEIRRHLDQTRTQLRAVFDSSVDLFALCNDHSVCQDISAFALEQLGHARDAILGRSIVESLSIDLDAKTISRLNEESQAGLVPAENTTIANTRGERVPVEIRIRTLSDQDAPQLWIIRNLSERNRLRAVEQTVLAVSDANTRLTTQNRTLTRQIRAQTEQEQIIGHSPAFKKVITTVDQVAPTDASVLICGETGTGKEKIAKRLHNQSNRADKPFIAVNCAALPAQLFEGELFGYLKGAFTGATQANEGRFIAADGGTLFLDEIAEIPIDLQSKLLRALEERSIRRLGSNTEQPIDVRIIAATNQKLELLVNKGQFRSDLYYRLNVIRIDLPGLKERKDDVPLLIAHFAREFAQHHRLGDANVPDTVLEQARHYDWPGNVRELRNYVERSVIIGRWEPLTRENQLVRANQDESTATLEEVERSHILSILKQTDGMIAGDRGAAAVLGLHPNTLRSRLKRLGVQRSGFSADQEQ